MDVRPEFLFSGVFIFLISRGRNKFCSTVRQEKSSSFCSIYPKQGIPRCTFLPRTQTLPAEGDSSPAASESTVVLPQPEGPITATNSPS